MSDLVLNNEGDLNIVQKSFGAIYDNDVVIPSLFDLETTNFFKKDLILKAIKTPKGKITMFILNEAGIFIKDNNYGTDIYKELSEGITLNFLSRVKAHITQSLINAKLRNNIADIIIGVRNSTTLEIKIIYNDNTTSDNLQIAI